MTTHTHTTKKTPKVREVALRVRSIAKLKRRLNALKIGHGRSGLIQSRQAVGININTVFWSVSRLFNDLVGLVGWFLNVLVNY